MSEYTREDILKLIEKNGGPEGLDLRDKDLSGAGRRPDGAGPPGD